MNRAPWKRALLTISIVLVVTVSGLLIRGNTGSAKTLQSADADEQASKAAETPKAEETPRAGNPVKAGETSKVDDSAKAREIPKAVAVPTAGGSPKYAEERRQLLETVGVLTAAHCYQTYLNIGLVADGKAKAIYTDDEAYKLLNSILSLLDSVDRKLANLGKIGLDKEDRDSLEQMRDVSDLLYRQAKQLEKFWDSGKDEDAAKYEDVRKDSWAAISKVTGSGR
jgi:hypothetical protein